MAIGLFIFMLFVTVVLISQEMTYEGNPLAELNQCIFNSANRLII